MPGIEDAPTLGSGFDYVGADTVNSGAADLIAKPYAGIVRFAGEMTAGQVDSAIQAGVAAATGGASIPVQAAAGAAGGIAGSAAGDAIKAPFNDVAESLEAYDGTDYGSTPQLAGDNTQGHSRTPSPAADFVKDYAADKAWSKVEPNASTSQFGSVGGTAARPSNLTGLSDDVAKTGIKMIV